MLVNSCGFIGEWLTWLGPRTHRGDMGAWKGSAHLHHLIGVHYACSPILVGLMEPSSKPDPAGSSQHLTWCCLAFGLFQSFGIKFLTHFFLNKLNFINCIQKMLLVGVVLGLTILGFLWTKLLFWKQTKKGLVAGFFIESLNKVVGICLNLLKNLYY